ncbi:MAG TPA: GAF domain-containing protein [Fimbriimonadaceae bacterium]|nr:GAF domain-containing protein [Fimbriimonadaceae bacterium]HRJ32053.1 GAF domain-containing protein [Fimbriimonadaceae bacterium]
MESKISEMASGKMMNDLLSLVVREVETDQAMQKLIEAASDSTRSRNVMVGLLDDEEGRLELVYGHGPEWSSKTEGEVIPITKHEGAGIVAYVAATGRPFMSGDVSDDPHYRDLFKTSQSEIAVPINDAHGRLRGVLNLESDRPDHYTQDDLCLALSISSLASLVLEREEMRRREEALIRIGSALDRALDEDELIDALLEVAGDVLRFQAVSIFLYDPVQDLFMLRGSVGQLKDLVGQVGYAAGEGVTGSVCASGQSVCINNPQADERWRGRYLELPSETIASFLAVAIVYRGKSIGAIRVLRRVTDNPYLDNHFTDEDQRLLDTIAEQVATGLENIRAVQKLLRSERMVAWGELSAKSSHMIGNRVFALRGDVNELGHMLKEREVQRDTLVELHQSLEINLVRIEEILQDFRDFLTATNMTPVTTDLNALVHESATEIFPRRSQVRLEFDLDPELPKVSADPRKLRRAISELVENALNYFEEGRLRVATRRALPEQVQSVGLPANKAFVAIEIQDQGPGVSADKKAQIFQPFYSGRVKGMGLGLSIVKGIAEAHGGNVYEAGQEGEGANFVILLPVADRH